MSAKITKKKRSLLTLSTNLRKRKKEKRYKMQNNVEIIQINISGEDKPGMTSSLTEILARYDAFILDIGQANIHQSLTLGILFRTTSDKSGNIMKELLFKASELGVMIRFTPISEQNYDNWVGRQGKNRYIITLLGRTVTARHIAEVTRVVAQHGLNIDAIKRLTGRIPLSEDDRAAKSCIELSVRGSLTDEERSTMQEGFMNLSEIGLDVSFQKDDIYRRSRRLICFDMDSTLIETEVIDELAERAGVGDAVREITARAMRGEIDFRESFTERVALLKGLDVSVMEEIARNLPITEGLERMMTILKRVGYKTAILSGGFTYFGNYLRQKYGFDYVYANELEIEQGKLTGRYVGEVVDGRRKAELLRLLCQFEEINIAQSVAVGDGANDLPMLNLAGLGIAFHAKPKVKATARQSISTIGLDGILYFLGLKDSRIEQ
ncbi:Phosphoserine phosphatase [Alistipes finegoldii]|nr:Phosphoserine phosphatase [Alistipes finegoldii]